MKYNTLLNSKLLIYCSILLIIIQNCNALITTGKNSIVSSAKVKQLIDKEVEKEVQNKSKQYEDQIKTYEEKISTLESNIKSLEEKNSTNNISTSSNDIITSCAIQDDMQTRTRMQILNSQKQLEQIEEQNKNNIIQLISHIDYQNSNNRMIEMQQMQQLQEANMNNNSIAASVMDEQITELRNDNVWYKIN